MYIYTYVYNVLRRGYFQEKFIDIPKVKDNRVYVYIYFEGKFQNPFPRRQNLKWWSEWQLESETKQSKVSFRMKTCQKRPVALRLRNTRFHSKGDLGLLKTCSRFRCLFRYPFWALSPLSLRESSLSFHWVFIEFSLSFHWVFIEFSLSFHWVFIEFSLSFHWVFIEFSFSFHWVFIEFSLSFHWVFIEFSLRRGALSPRDRAVHIQCFESRVIIGNW